MWTQQFWVYLIMTIALVVGGVVVVDARASYVKSIGGEIVFAFPNISKYPQQCRVTVRADDGAVFVASLPNTQVAPGVTPVYRAGTPVRVTVWRSRVFGRVVYRATLFVP
jgi:hypothetical protein